MWWCRHNRSGFSNFHLAQFERASPCTEPSFFQTQRGFTVIVLVLVIEARCDASCCARSSGEEMWRKPIGKVARRAYRAPPLTHIGFSWCGKRQRLVLDARRANMQCFFDPPSERAWLDSKWVRAATVAVMGSPLEWLTLSTPIKGW